MRIPAVALAQARATAKAEVAAREAEAQVRVEESERWCRDIGATRDHTARLSAGEEAVYVPWADIRHEKLFGQWHLPPAKSLRSVAASCNPRKRETIWLS